MKKEKTAKKYVTLKDGGMDFRTMAKLMTKNGFKMNHATARNQLILAVKYLLGHISSSLKTGLPQTRIEEMLDNQDIHENLSDIIYLAYKEEEKDNDSRKK